MSTTTKNKGLKNPAVVAVASSAAGSKAVETVKASTAIAVSVVPFFIKLTVAGFVCYGLYSVFANHFSKRGYDGNLDPANVSDGQAQAKAEAIHQAMYGVGANRVAVGMQLSGLNHNGYIKVYNAFGKRKGADFLADAMTMDEWFYDQFGTEGDDIEYLRYILSGEF